MNAEFYVNAALGESIEELADFMLRLRYRHAIARNNHDLVRGSENCRRFFRASAANRALFGNFACGNLHLAESPKEDIRERPVHGFAHDHRENETGGAVQSAG